MTQKKVVIPEDMWSYDKSEPVEKRKTIYPTLQRLEDFIEQLIENEQLSDFDTTLG